MSFALQSLDWWAPFSRVRTVPKANLVSGNARGYLSTLEQVTALLWTSVSSRRRVLKQLLKVPPSRLYLELQAEFPGPWGLLFPASKSLSDSDFPMGLSWGMLTCPLK